MNTLTRVACALALSATSVAVSQAPPPTQGVVLKGKAPVSDQVLSVKLPRPREATLPNGLYMMVLEDRRAPQVTFTIQIPGAGGFFDEPSTIGVATTTAAMMREGTTTRNTIQIAEQLETMAATLAVTTGMSATVASISGAGLTEHIDRIFDMAADVLLRPTFPDEEFVKYRQRTLAGLNQQRSFPGFLVQERWSKTMYGDHPAGRLAISPAQLNAITRDQLVAHHKARYVPDHAVIAIAGDISLADARRLVESKLGGWARAGVPAPRTTDPAVAGPGRVHLVDRANSVQTSFVVGSQAINRTDPDYDALQVMNAVVGGGPTGRLFTNLRETKGYTYGAYSGMSAGQFRGVWSARTDVRSEVTEPALTDLMEELRQIRDVPVPAKELADKKRSLVASFALSLESPQAMLNYYITSWMYKLPADYWDRYPERIMRVMAPQVQTVARKYLDPSRVHIIAVGDAKKVGTTLKKFGELDTYDVEGKKVTAVVP